MKMKMRLRIAVSVMVGILACEALGCGNGTGDPGTSGTGTERPETAGNPEGTESSSGTVNSGDAAGTANAEGTDTTRTEQEGEQKEWGQIESGAELAGIYPPLKLSVMLPYGTNEHDNNEVVKRFRGDIEAYTNTDIEWIFYDLDMYYEKLTLLYASGDLPSILVVKKNAEFINAVENGAFWDVGDSIYDYQNLKELPETVFLNASINGDLYGVPRGRTLARNGFGYRLDWLNNLGLKEPETLDEFYEMLFRFTNDDPDGNGKNDTYGLGFCNYMGSWDIMQIWFGVPNKWGIGDDGNLVPDFLTEEYDTALKWFRKIYSEGLVNPDFMDYPSADWNELLSSGTVGASVDVLDRFRKCFGDGTEKMIAGAVDAGYGIRCLPTAGYSDLLAISTSKVKTEEDMRRALQFLDDINDAEMRNLWKLGYEGITFGYDETGTAFQYTKEEKKIDFNLSDGYTQLPSYQSQEELAKTWAGVPSTDPIRLLEDQLYAENIQYCIPNYGAPYTSKTYVEQGAQLDEIMSNARLDYITGVIDDVGLYERKEQWKRSGGDQVIEEMNELYHASK